MRNWLVHHYFRERAEAFMTFDGRCVIVEELEAARDELREADQRLDAFVSPIRRRLGLTDEMLAAEYERMRKELRG